MPCRTAGQVMTVFSCLNACSSCHKTCSVQCLQEHRKLSSRQSTCCQPPFYANYLAITNMQEDALIPFASSQQGYRYTITVHVAWNFMRDHTCILRSLGIMQQITHCKQACPLRQAIRHSSTSTARYTFWHRQLPHPSSKLSCSA